MSLKNELKKAILDYSGKVCVDVKWFWDPKVSDCLAARGWVEKTPGGVTEPWDMLFTHVSAHPKAAELSEKLEEVEFETWPPQSGEPRFFV